MSEPINDDLSMCEGDALWQIEHAVGDEPRLSAKRILALIRQLRAARKRIEALEGLLTDTLAYLERRGSATKAIRILDAALKTKETKG